MAKNIKRVGQRKDYDLDDKAMTEIAADLAAETAALFARTAVVTVATGLDAGGARPKAAASVGQAGAKRAPKKGTKKSKAKATKKSMKKAVRKSSEKRAPNKSAKKIVAKFGKKRSVVSGKKSSRKKASKTKKKR